MATKENQSIAGYQAHIGRLTRSRSAALRAALPPVPSVQVNKSKEIPSDENAQIEIKSKKLSSDKNAKICISSNLGVSKGRLKKLDSDENANIDISSNLGVSKGKSEKSDSNENSRIWVSKGKNKIGVSSNVGSDENTQIGVQKGKTKRAALTEITNNGGVSLKLTRPCSGLSEITNNGRASLKLTRPNSALSEITNNGGVSLKLIKPDDLIKLKGKRPALGECTNNETGTKLGNPNKRQKLMKAANDVPCDGAFKRSFPVPKVQTKVFSGAKMGICKANQENKTGQNAILTSSSLSHINTLIKDNGSGPKELDPPVENLEQDKENECGVLFLEESTALMINNDLKEGDTTSSSVVNIDGDKSNTLLCTIYAPDLYSNLRATELIRRPSFNFLEMLQNDVTQSMRAILVDWLVEVCDEYRLVPDTLYLTVYLIDRFLSLSYIERQRLQLLGITCMLIASKYEEICAPRVEEFCFITDNTYNRNQVLEMEYQVLSQLGYHISIPTAKTFLRRFLRAAQASTKAPPTLMHLTNYLAELTLVEYNFTKYLPSQIAASAVFLARWTLDQSDHPWNETLEHYTCYKSSDLKASILSLQELQLNTQNCPLQAIRDKYKNEKFESVANLKSPELIGSLFC